MPLHSADREAKGGVPPGASHFLTRIVAADALLIAFPEHNGHFPAAFKNLFDSASRANATVFQEKADGRNGRQSGTARWYRCPRCY